MSNEGEKKCPLCAEEMDWTDRQFNPCKCGYKVCIWCWHHIMHLAEKDETEGRCPACRTPYDKEKIVAMEANCQKVVSTKKEQKSKPQKPKLKKPEVSKDLTSVRVIQRRMAYVIGLPLRLADENLLQRKEYFGQYGKVTKVSLSRTAGGSIQQFVNDTCSIYVTYSKEEEAIRCIQSVHGFVLEGRFLRASFGTAKYCHAWLRNTPCTNFACLYLHSIGADEDSFSKDEEAAVHTRNRVHQIVGATHNMQRLSGNMLPPPIDDPFNSSRVGTDKAAQRDITHSTINSNGLLTCSHSSKDKDGRIKTPNRTFVDIVGGSSSGPEKDSSVAEERKILNLCSDFSSVTMDEGNHLETQYLNSMLCKVSSLGHLPVGLARDKDFLGYFKPFREYSKFSVLVGADFKSSDQCIMKGQSCLISDSEKQVWPTSCSDVREGLLSFDDQRLKGSDSLSQESSVLASSYPIRISGCSNGRVQQRKDSRSLSDYNLEHSTVHNHVDEASISFAYVNSVPIDGYSERKFQSFTDSDRNFRSCNEREFQSFAESDRNFRYCKSFSNEEMVEQLRRLDDDNITNDGDRSALNVVESSIISNILSMDFDACDDFLTSHGLADLFDGTGGWHGSWNFRKSDESRFSFAKKENSENQETVFDSSLSNIGQVSKKYSSFPDSLENKEHYFGGPRHHVSRAQSSTPPGFSVPSREPSPGFSARERTNQVFSASSGSNLVKTSSLANNQCYARSAGNKNNAHDFDFMDPAVLAVGRGKSTNMLNNSGFEARSISTPQPTTYEDEAKLWHLMQRSGSYHHDPKYSLISQENQSANREHGYSGHNGNGISAMNDMYGYSSSMLMDQRQTYSPNPFPGTHLSQQEYGNGHISNGYCPGLDKAEIPRNERIGLNKYYPGYGDLMLQMPGTGDVYNRVYGL